MHRVGWVGGVGVNAWQGMERGEAAGGGKGSVAVCV